MHGGVSRRCVVPRGAAGSWSSPSLGSCVVVILGLLLNGRPSPTGQLDTSDATAWDRVLDQIGPDGDVSFETALAAFSVAVGPLPGVPMPERSGRVASHPGPGRSAGSRAIDRGSPTSNGPPSIGISPPIRTPSWSSRKRRASAASSSPPTGGLPPCRERWARAPRRRSSSCATSTTRAARSAGCSVASSRLPVHVGRQRHATDHRRRVHAAPLRSR